MHMYGIYEGFPIKYTTYCLGVDGHIRIDCCVSLCVLCCLSDIPPPKINMSPKKRDHVKRK